MKTKISQDIGYIGTGGKTILDSIFKCSCGSKLLMFGCENENCDNFYLKRIKQENTQHKTKVKYTKSFYCSICMERITDD